MKKFGLLIIAIGIFLFSACVFGADFEIKENTLIKYTGREASVIIPENVTKIGKEAFMGNKTLKSVKAGKNLTIIDEKAFLDCINLEEIDFPGIKSIEEEAFSGCGIRKLSFSTSLKEVDDFAFAECSSLTEISFSDNTKEIDKGAFMNCANLKKAKLPNFLPEIEKFTFYGCSSLEKINMPRSLKKINDRAFYGCKGLTKIDFPKNLRCIESQAFAYCTGLKEITVYHNTIDVAITSFAKCDKKLIVWCEEGSDADKMAYANGYRSKYFKG